MRCSSGVAVAGGPGYLSVHSRHASSQHPGSLSLPGDRRTENKENVIHCTVVITVRFSFYSIYVVIQLLLLSQRHYSESHEHSDDQARPNHTLHGDCLLPPRSYVQSRAIGRATVSLRGSCTT